MDYVEAASALGEAIRNSVEFQNWQNAELAMLQDEKAQTLMSEFKDLQMKLVHASRDDMDKDELEKIRDVLMDKQKELNEYEVTKNYFDGKKGFETMMRTVNDIIQHFLSGDNGGGCSGSCSTCSGCH
ncbi:MAG: YlbF family regulator [Ruminococcaceae bacterium]|nr:YlbF family regulator [Oscillospiraceae bacterium]